MTNPPPSGAAAGESSSLSGSSLSQNQHQHLDDHDDHSFSPASSSEESSSPHSHSHSRSSSHVHSHSHSHSLSHSHKNFLPSLLSSWTAPKDANPDQHHVDDAQSDTTKTVQVELRQADALVDDPFVTRVVQTVELVQVVDAAGQPVSLHTVYAPPNTVVVDRESGETVAVSAPGSSKTAPASSPGASHDPSHSSLTYQPSLTYSTTPHSSLISTPTELPATPSSGSLSGSAPLPSTASLVLPSGVPNNATSSLLSQSQNSTVSSSDYSTRSAMRYTSGSLTSSISFTSTSDNEIETSYSTTTSDATWTALSDRPSSTSGGESSADATRGGADATASAASEDTSGGGSGGNGPGNLSPQEKQIVGGVVGSVAGVAFLLLLVMMALKWKKRRHDVQELIGGNGARAISASPTGGPGGGGSGAGGQMAERSTAFMVPGALASLTAKKDNRAGQSSAGSGERGFVRVSGKKLPSVLQHGGDGYSDPRQSTMSGDSDYYRGSQSFDPTSGRLALGTPMRPVSGVPIMRTGPGRTPVTEQNPFSDPPSPPLPPPPRDAVGRSLTSQDGSRGSGSRFQENM